MKGILEANGWEQFFQCFCNGVFTQKFRNPDKKGYKINIQPKKKRFVIKKSNLTVKDDHDYKLADYLKTI